jgi:hypothetical protein
MNLLTWKGDRVVDGTNARMRSVIQTDYEENRRHKKLAKLQESQQIDVFVALAWITTITLTAVWLRILYIVSKAGVEEIAHLVNR